MTFKDINQKFTETVAEYMEMGFTINVGTMGGSQGEYGKVDLTDGKVIIRVLVDSFIEGGILLGLEGVKIVVGRSTDNVLPNEKGGMGSTIWNQDLDVLSVEKFYRLSRDDEWYGTFVEASDARDKQHERFDNKEHYYGFGWSREKDMTTDEAIDIVTPFIRRELGLKRVRRNDIEIWKYRYGDRRQYRVEYGAKTLILD